MAKNTDRKDNAPSIRLKVRELKDFQERYGIKNLLRPDAEDTEKMLSLEFLCDFIRTGTAWMGDDAPNPDDMEVRELVDMFKTFHEGKS